MMELSPPGSLGVYADQKVAGFGVYVIEGVSDVLFEEQIWPV